MKRFTQIAHCANGLRLQSVLVVVCLCSMGPVSCGGGGSAAMPLPDEVSLPLQVRAEIDGRSQLLLQGNQIWWHHFELRRRACGVMISLRF